MLTDRLPPAAHRSPAVVSAGNGFGALLQNYFRSGWAFLIPYLAAYLLYAWLKWPVNPVAAGSSTVGGGQWTVIPCLLHVYWALHAINLGLGAIALRSWWRESGATVTGATDDSENTANHSATPQPLVSPKSDVGGSTDSPSTVHRAAQPLLSTAPQSGHRLPLPGDWPGQTPGWQQPATAINRPPFTAIWRFAPWLLLALLFYIPGVYLEFPSDPWEHYTRINGCKDLNLIQSGLVGIYKTPYYFFAYSWLGQLSISWQLRGLDIYQAALATLISWQYFLLARTCGLQTRTALLFTLAQALVFGNDLFGFYRYYILSSSAFSQLGAIAAIRLCVHLSNCFKSAEMNSLLSQRIGLHVPVHRFLFAIILVLGLAAINHIQGLAIAGLGILAIGMWHAVKCGRRLFLYLVSLLILVSVACSLFWVRNPLIDNYYKGTGWLNPWYGFDLFSIHSNASHRMILIMGLSGVLSLIAGTVLLRRNHIVGWLTVMPVLALQLPFISIPLANAFADKSPLGIVAFNRLFFAIPAGLSLVVLACHFSDSDTLSAIRHRVFSLLKRSSWGNKPENLHVYPGLSQVPSNWFGSLHMPHVLLLLICACLTIPPPGYPYCNRLWNAWASVPADLRMTKVLTNFYEDPAHQSARLEKNSLFVASAATSTVLHAFTPIDTLFWEQRLLHLPQQRSPAADLIRINTFIDSERSTRHLYFVPPKADLMFTPQSYTACLTHHWNPVEVALAHTH